MGGVTPLGYAVQSRKLIVVPAEAKTVRYIYQRYLELGSVRLLQRDLEQRGIRSKVRTHQDGTRAGGRPFSRGALYALLANPIYIGEISHKGARYAGQHDPILDRALWDAVEHRLREQGLKQREHTGKVTSSPLMAKLFDEDGGRLSPSHAIKNGRRYRYYVSRTLLTGTSQEVPQGWRLPALQIEKLVAEEVANILNDRSGIAAALEKNGIPADQCPSALAAAERLRTCLLSEVERADALLSLIDRVELGRGSFRVTISLGALFGDGHAEITLARELPLAIKRRGVEMRLVSDSHNAPPAKVDPILLKEVARAYRCFDALLTGRASSIPAVAMREGIHDRYVSSLLPLAFLAPEIVEAIVRGTQPKDLTAKKLIRRIRLPLEWQAQKQALRFS